MKKGKLCILVDRPRFSSFSTGAILAGFEWNIIEERLQRAGLLPEQYGIESISKTTSRPCPADYQRCLKEINDGGYSVILALDEIPLQFATGLRSIRKWQLSPLETQAAFKAKKCIPTYHPDQIRKDLKLGFYLEMSIKRAAEHLEPGPWVRKEKRYLLNPPTDQIIDTLERIRTEEWHSIDIETGRGQVNTFGVSWTVSDGIAFKILPDDLPAKTHYKIWSLIDKICRADSKKVMQNGAYERMIFSRYGIPIRGHFHDTMFAMRLLFPDFEVGLGNVGRIFTMEPYWKDVGKENDNEESGVRDWGNIRDWNNHILYNALDHSNTLEAALNQRVMLKERGMLDFHDNYMQKLFDPTYEMSTRGFPLNTEKRDALVTEYETESNELIGQLSEKINPRSSKQKLDLIIGQGIKPPNKRCKSTGALRPSADELSLKKMRLKHPENNDLALLLKIAKKEKALSSYLRVRTLPDNRVRAMLNPFATKTGRMASKKDAFDGGFNTQTMGKVVKSMLEFPEEDDRVFIELDLSKAESCFVAYDSCDETLIGMLARGEDIHKYVAAEIYIKPMSEITDEERQLGKKSGHGANYSMGPKTFQDSCLKEMDLVIDMKMAKRVLDSYHKLFPGIRRWHGEIREELYNTRKLTNPFGFERYFYGRMDDTTFRDAYSFKPQSTIPMITNYLLFGLLDERRAGKVDFQLHNQVHDSIVISCRSRFVKKIAEYAKDPSLWHPEVILPAGKLILQTNVQAGRCLGTIKEVEL